MSSVWLFIHLGYTSEPNLPVMTNPELHCEMNFEGITATGS